MNEHRGLPRDDRLIVLPDLEQISRFMRRETSEQMGGSPEIPLMEDIEMSRALHRAGNIVRIPLRVTTSSRRFLERGVLRQTLMNATSMFRYLCLGATPADIART